MIEVPSKIVERLVLPVVTQVNSEALALRLLRQSRDVDVGKLRYVRSPGIRLEKTYSNPRDVLLFDPVKLINRV